MSRRGSATVKPRYECILLVGGNGHGAVNTRIRRYSGAQIDRSGESISWSDDSDDGTTVTIKKAGLYLFGIGGEGQSDAHVIGISINSSQLRTDFQSITIADQLIYGHRGQANFISNTQGARYLEVGDVLRPHSDTRDNATDSNAYFWIARMEIW